MDDLTPPKLPAKTALQALKFLRRQRARSNAHERQSSPTAPKHAPYILRNLPSTSDKLIVHVNGNFLVGGSTQLIVDLIENLSDAYQHEIVVPSCPNPPPYGPVVVHTFPLGRMQELHAYLSTTKPDIVHIHYWSRDENKFDATGIWYRSVLWICADLGLSVVQNVNVPTTPMVGRAILRNVFVSHYVQDQYDRRDAAASVIYPGSDFSHFVPNQEPPLPSETVGMVYRLDNDKLNLGSIEPFLELAKLRKSAKCLIVGSGMFLDAYRERVNRERLSEQFEFTGMVSYADLPALYGRMAVFVAPVHNESFGQVSPFAMGMGLPVAGYDVGALAEILGSRDTLVAQGDSKALAVLLDAMLDDRPRRQMLADLNIRRAHELFSREGMVSSYRRLYADLLMG